MSFCNVLWCHDVIVHPTNTHIANFWTPRRHPGAARKTDRINSITSTTDMDRGTSKGPSTKFNVARKGKIHTSYFLYSPGNVDFQLNNLFQNIFSHIFVIVIFKWHCQVLYCVQWNHYTITHLQDNCGVIFSTKSRFLCRGGGGVYEKWSLVSFF